MLEPVYRYTSSEIFGSTFIYMYYEYVFIVGIIFWIFRKNKISIVNLSLFFIPALVFKISSYLFDPNIYARTIITYTITIFLCALYAHNNLKLSQDRLFELFKMTILGGSFLCGFAASAHLFGNIVFGLGSSGSASAGLPPIHLSALLCFSSLCKIILLNHNQLNKPIINYLSILVYIIVMVLTFSRTGVIALFASASIYFLTRLKTAIRFTFFGLLISPILFYAFHIMNDYTDGMLLIRYMDDVSGDRAYIFRSALELLKGNIFGVGSGNAYFLLEEQGFLSAKIGLHNPFLTCLS